MRRNTTEKRMIRLEGKTYAYHWKRRAYQKRINIIVHQSGELVVTSARSVPESHVVRFLFEQRQWIGKKAQAQENKPNVSYDPAFLRLCKRRLREEVEAKLAHFNVHYDLPYGKISIRNQQTRWGSCSSTGNLSFNMRLYALPERLRDYVIVHELCHIAQMNHGPQFWRLVEQKIPYYIAARKELKSL